MGVVVPESHPFGQLHTWRFQIRFELGVVMTSLFNVRLRSNILLRFSRFVLPNVRYSGSMLLNNAMISVGGLP